MGVEGMGDKSILRGHVGGGRGGGGGDWGLKSIWRDHNLARSSAV